MRHFKLSTLCALIFITLFSNAALPEKYTDKLKDEGIKLYKENKYNEAIDTFLKIEKITRERRNKIDYEIQFLLGELYFKIDKYEKSLNYFFKCYYRNYKINDSLLNISKIFCRQKIFKKCRAHLLVYYSLKGKHKLITDDKNFNDFKNSDEFKTFTIQKNKISKGITPRLKKTILRYIFSKKYNYPPYPITPSPGFFHFNKNGTFETAFPGGFGGFCHVGKWQINDKKKILILKLTGIIAENDFLTRNKDHFIGKRFQDIIKIYKYNSFIFKNTQAYFMPYENDIIEEIPFKNIRLNQKLYYLSIEGDESILVKYNIIGNLLKNKIIRFPIGLY